MHPRPICCRRLRRLDAEAAFALLEASGLAVPADDRARRHRFRLLAADLGSDCYVALADETVVGLVHVTYSRHLLDGQRATLELLLVAPGRPVDVVVDALATLVAERARRRGCRSIDWRDPLRGAVADAFAVRLGAVSAGDHLRVEIPASAK